MKKILAVLFLFLMAFIIVLPVLAGAETIAPMPEAELPAVETVTSEPTPNPSTGPWTWSYLASIAGATAATLLIVQFFKVPLDKVWKIPTRLFVYAIAFTILTVATAFTSGLDSNTFLLCVLNAFIVALAAYGSYEVTFARSDRS